MSKTLVDTNMLVAFYNESDTLHEKAYKALVAAEKPLVVHEYVAIESITVLMMRVGKEAADSLIDIFITNADYEFLAAPENAFLSASNAFKHIKSKQLSFIDAALLALSSVYSVLTFDDALNRAIKRKAQI